MTDVAVVTIAQGRHHHLAAQHRSLAMGSRRPDEYLVVAMGDPDLAPGTVDDLERDVVRVPVPDQGLPLAAARNRGVSAALDRGASTVILLDVDCLAGHDLVAAYASTISRHPGTVWSGPVTYLPPAPATGYDLDRLEDLDDPHPARPAPRPGELLACERPELFWSLSFAVSAPDWHTGGGFCEDYVGYGGEDTDLARSLTSAGIALGWVGAARAYHQHHAVEDPPVRHLDAILRNARVFHERWGEWPMIGWLHQFEELGLVRRTARGWERREPG